MSHSIAGRGGIDIVDAQIHLTPNPSADSLTCAMDALGIRAVMLDELWGRNEHDHGTPCIEFGGGAYRPISPLATAASLQDSTRFSFLQRVSRLDPDLQTWLPMLAQTPGCRSLRLVTYSRSDREAFLAGGYDHILSLAQEYDLPLSLLTRDAGVLFAHAAPRFPQLRFIIDHCGWVRSVQDWESVLALARYDNTWLKWSHAARAFGQDGAAAETIQTAFGQACVAFGAERILWASDVTHEESSQTWAQLLGFILGNPALSDNQREWVLGRTARQVFRWPNAPAAIDVGI